MARFSNLLTALAATLLLTLSACQEGGEAGSLFGQWRLEGATNLYVSFSGSVTLLRSTDHGMVYGNFQHVGDSLFIQCYSAEATSSDTTIVEQHFGWKPMNNIRLKIATLDDDRLVLVNGNQQWSFQLY